ncbi:MAG: sigma-70 family RNA polymerase sigma factor [Gammaproteobacteria bacterium]|nr:sigma-70 family RNA polymerase sigma factor [Gammaproteobacteria bacterium]
MVAASGQRERFAAQVLPHLDDAYRFARWLGNARADAEDIVQEAMLRAFRGFAALRAPAVKPWLLTIVRNCHVDAARQRQRREADRQALADAQGAGAPDPQLAAIQSQSELELQRLLSGLSAEHRETLALREVAELSYREIATLTGVPVGTVMSRLSRARESLREHWQAETQELDHGMR